MKLSSSEYFIKAGETDQAFAILSDVTRDLQPPFDKFASIGYAKAYVELKDIDNAKKHTEVLSKAIEVLSSVVGNMLDDLNTKLLVKIAELEKDYDKATAMLLTIVDSSSTDLRRYLPLGRLYRLSGQFDEAEKYLLKQLNLTPNLAEAHSELGQVYIHLNNGDKAREHLQRAADIWKNAEDIFEPAKKNHLLMENL